MPRPPIEFSRTSGLSTSTLRLQTSSSSDVPGQRLLRRSLSSSQSAPSGLMMDDFGPPRPSRLSSYKDSRLALSEMQEPLPSLSEDPARTPTRSVRSSQAPSSRFLSADLTSAPFVSRPTDASLRLSGIMKHASGYQYLDVGNVDQVWRRNLRCGPSHNIYAVSKPLPASPSRSSTTILAPSGSVEFPTQSSLGRLITLAPRPTGPEVDEIDEVNDSEDLDMGGSRGRG
mmetsp:Transcript_9162/g.18633  ORF Transcript_9162/g.18633 Transcript_9162/m.18633 type:complete len:229 (-) Transcript_9162:419-1105(-)